MSRRTSEIVAVGSVLVIGGVLHVLLRNNLTSFVPLPLLVSLVLSWILASPGYAVIMVVIVSELFSFLPPGLMTTVILTPVIIRRAFRSTEIDVSFTFAALLTTTTILQLILVSLPALYTSTISLGFLAAIRTLPWHYVLITIASTTLVAWLLCVSLQAMIPSERRATITFDRQVRRRHH